MSEKMQIKNSDGDFFQAQNYVLQLLAEKKLSQSAFVLYSFYRSLAGFEEIRCGYRFISLNSGLSKGSITNGNKILQEEGLIKVHPQGPNRPFIIELISGSFLPRRKLKKVEVEISAEESSSSADEQVVQNMNAEDLQSSAAEQINIDSNKYSTKKDNTTAARAELVKKHRKLKPKYPTEHYELLANRFMDYWCSYYNSPGYAKTDYAKLLEIEEPLDAMKYIPVLWSLDEVDNWIRNSDHSISIFVKEYNSGRLQSYYPQTRAYYEDKKEERDQGGG